MYASGASQILFAALRTDVIRAFPTSYDVNTTKVTSQRTGDRHISRPVLQNRFSAKAQAMRRSDASLDRYAEEL